MVNGLKYVNIGAGIGLGLMIYKTHKTLWAMDMKHKRALDGEESAVLSR
jgi:hypothetical protein